MQTLILSDLNLKKYLSLVSLIDSSTSNSQLFSRKKFKNLPL